MKSPADAPEKKNEDVPEQFSPVHYWRDPIPDILDPDEPLKNAEKSERKSEKPKVAKPKSWLASNMAGMFDRKPKPKVKVEKKQPEKKTTAPDVKPSIPTLKSLKTEKSKEEKKINQRGKTNRPPRRGEKGEKRIPHGSCQSSKVNIKNKKSHV